MSIRSEPKEMSPGMAQALTIPQHVMTAAQAEGPLMAPAGPETAMVSAPVNEQHLAPANDFNTSNPNHPLKRTVVINIRSSLADLCLKKSRATWSPPSSEATKVRTGIGSATHLPMRAWRSQATCILPGHLSAEEVYGPPGQLGGPGNERRRG
jgi:hypothetical protein